MSAPPLYNSSLVIRLRTASVVCGAAGTLIGLTVLLGWISGNDLLKGAFFAGITMKTNAALCLVLVGGAVVLVAVQQRSALHGWLRHGSAVLVLGVAAATLSEHVLGFNFGIDELLFRESAGALGTQSPNRMGPVASSCLSLLALALLVLDKRTRSGGAPFQPLALSVMLVATVSLLGYIFDARQLFAIARYTGISLPTAAALWLLALGLLLACPEAGLMRRLVGNDSGALMIRRLLPAALILPILLMVLRILGQELGLYDTPVARALLVVSFILTFTALIWRTGKVVSQQASEAARAERALSEHLVHSLEVLEDADRRKTEFLATLAHELRNPLAPVRSAVHLLKASSSGAANGMKAQADAARAYAVIDRQMDHLTRLIDDLMDVSRIARDKLELQKSPAPLSDIIGGAVDASRHALDAHGHQLSIALPPEELHLDADTVRLVQVFTNLLTNAGRYTPAGGKISVTAERDGAELVVRVSDTGIGIAPDQLPHVFDIFYQAERENRRGRHGLGIGLTLVRRIVVLHGGSVSARSDGPGLGSTFTVRLPLSHSEAAGVAPTRRASNAEFHLRGLSVLVVEDNQDSAEMLSALLEHSGARVHVAPDGETAVSLAEQLQPEVILLDIGLPHMSGYDVAREIRRTPWGAHTFIVALTGWGHEEDRARSKDAGFDHHLVKPVKPDVLFELIGELPRAPAKRTEAAIQA